MGFVIHDLGCSRCTHTKLNYPVELPKLPKCPKCKAKMEVRWDLDPKRNFQHSVHPSERAVVYMDPKTGHVAYPGRNDRPMDARYKDAGYKRVEFESLRDLDKFCKQRNLVNDKANFDSNGKSDNL